jgi:prevent-host-death family protein
MTDIPARELRNKVSEILRRVEAGERLRVTVSGRPVAELAPLAKRPGAMRWEELMRDNEHWRADARLTADLRALLPDTTDDDPIR